MVASAETTWATTFFRGSDSSSMRHLLDNNVSSLEGSDRGQNGWNWFPPSSAATHPGLGVVRCKFNMPTYCKDRKYTFNLLYKRLLPRLHPCSVRKHIVLMFYNAVFCEQNLWDSRNANLGPKCAYDTMGTWPIMRHYYETTGFCIGILVGAHGLDARNILGTTSLQISAASKMYLHGRWLLWIMICSVQCFLNFQTSASAGVYRKQFHICFPVPETGCPIGHTGLASDDDHILVAHECWVRKRVL